MRRAFIAIFAGLFLGGLAAFAMLYEHPDPVRQRLELVTLGMTQDDVEIAMDMAPTEFSEWRGLDVLIFQGRTGDAEVQIDQVTRRVVNKGWADTRRESDFALIFRDIVKKTDSSLRLPLLTCQQQELNLCEPANCQ